ncbi:MAG: bifunctional metallophosphatase/5'-nucleotidase [Alphaproteobacteria bacterium]|nr:bifunctional metallophosphatase/5'-nucleotidase [Alphaproteobacteria bacterium]
MWPALLLWACAPRSNPPAASLDAPAAVPLGPGRLVIAHTNDIHAHYEPEPASWLDGEPALGGFVAIDSWVRSLERQHGADAVLYLDAGDVLSGTPLMEIEARGIQGGAMLDLFEAVGVDAWVPGNHEFDRGFDHAAAFVADSRTPVVSANLRAPCSTRALGCAPALAGSQPWEIFEVNGLKVGVFGLTTSGLSHLTDADTMARLAVLDHAEAAAQAVAALEPQVDLVVALTHIGLDSDRALAEAVPGIDLIVGGHSHTRMQAAERVGDTWIVQAGAYGRLLGVAEVQTDGEGGIAHLQWQAQELWPDALPLAPDPDVVRLVDGYSRAVDAVFDVTVGTAETALVRSHGDESPLGRWASDVVRLAAGSDVGIYNAGGIRADLPAGRLTRRDLYEIFPFGNEVVTFDVTGQELIGILLSAAAAEADGGRGAMQLSGLQLRWRVRMGAPELVEVQVGGQPLDLRRTYSVATNSFVATQWQRNLGVEPRDVRGIGRTVLDSAVDLAARGPVVDPGDRRSVRLDGG